MVLNGYILMRSRLSLQVLFPHVRLLFVIFCDVLPGYLFYLIALLIQFRHLFFVVEKFVLLVH